MYYIYYTVYTVNYTMKRFGHLLSFVLYHVFSLASWLLSLVTLEKADFLNMTIHQTQSSVLKACILRFRCVRSKQVLRFRHHLCRNTAAACCFSHLQAALDLCYPNI